MLTRTLVALCVTVAVLSILSQSARSYLRDMRHGKSHAQSSFSVQSWFSQTSLGKYMHHSADRYALDRVAWMKEEGLLK